MAPATGFEPVTKWLTATYSTAELRRIKILSCSKKVCLIYYIDCIVSTPILQNLFLISKLPQSD